MNEVRITAQNTNVAVKILGTEHKRDKIERWLSAPDPSINYNKALKQRHKDSGLWFLQTKAFEKWKKRRNSFLWLHGIPGCGKTILSSTIIEHLDRTASHTQPLLYFYFDFSDIDKQSLESMIRSLIRQLYYKRKDTQKQLDSLFSSCADGHRQPDADSLCTHLLDMTQQVDEVWIVLDALDECSTRKGTRTKGLLSWMEDLLCSELRNVHLLATSRQEEDIESALSKWARIEDMMPIQSALVTDDIRAYVRTRVKEDDGLRRWRSQPDVQEEIETRLMEKVCGM
jgi:NACHT domain